MQKIVTRRTVPTFPLATLALCLLGGTAVTSRPMLADAPVLPDVNLPDTPVNPDNPISQLPPPPKETPLATMATTAARSVITKAAKPESVTPVALPDAPTTVNADLSTQGTTQQPKARPGESLQAVARRLNVAMPLPQGLIVVSKSQRRLDIYNGEVLLKSYRVALGPSPVGHKKRQGDGRTPEGQFYICTRNSRTSAFHIFLGLSYPALPDATRGVKNKAITAREFQIIRQRLASRGAPLWETRLGGWVGIHGGSDAPYAKRTIKARKSRDWTAGCVALTNREIEELHAATRIGTPVLVQP